MDRTYKIKSDNSKYVLAIDGATGRKGLAIIDEETPFVLVYAVQIAILRTACATASDIDTRVSGSLTFDATAVASIDQVIDLANLVMYNCGVSRACAGENFINRWLETIAPSLNVDLQYTVEGRPIPPHIAVIGASETQNMRRLTRAASSVLPGTRHDWITSEVADSIADWIRNGRILDAVKVIRAHTSFSLRECKHICDEMSAIMDMEYQFPIFPLAA